MDKIKMAMTAVISVLMSCLGILAVPVFILAGCNVLDYLTGLGAAKGRQEEISSYKGFQGIFKKVCMWILVLIGALIDILVQYAMDVAGIPIDMPFIMGTVVAVWLVVNEIISILENIIDSGVKLPPFLLPAVKYIKRQVEEVADITKEQDEEDADENGKENIV